MGRSMSQSPAFGPELIESLHERLRDHPLYRALRSMSDLRLFMDHHVYAVWDFMSLLKYLQHRVAPSTFPWRPQGSASARYFINQIVLAEESDEGLPDARGTATHASHFELYCDAMREAGGDPSPAIRFAEVAAAAGIKAAFSLGTVPPAARHFMESTFEFIAGDKPHVVGAAFALGREHVIPEMFRAFLDARHIDDQDAPAFHYYLERHIHLDEGSHAPLALRMVEELIDGDPGREREAEQAALAAVEARVRLWDGVYQAVQAARGGPRSPSSAATLCGSSVTG
jgi:hypothetical protein